MKKDTQKVAMTSENIENDNLNKLRAVFPQFVKDGSIDFDALQAFFKKEGILAGVEKYGLNWAGKSKAFSDIRRPATGTLTPQLNESKDWDTTENIFIEGENLEVLKLLQKKYANPGKIKMIYIDPPYNTGKDFIYKDNFTQNVSDYYEQTGQSKDGIKLASNLESNGRYHSDWLTMMYPRLFLARNLLKDDGVIFVSINDHEVANLRMIMDEIFGEDNFVEYFSWVKTSTPPGLSTKSRKTIEYILCYEKNSSNTEFTGELLDGGDQPLLNSGNSKRDLVFPKEIVKFNKNGIFKAGQYDRVTLKKDINVTKGYSTTDIVLGGEFKWIQETVNKEIENGTTFIVKSEKFAIRFIRKEEGGYKAPTNMLKEKYIYPLINKDNNVGTNETGSSELEELLGGRYFDFPKPVSLIKHISNFCTSGNDIILDFFAGSGTTAHAVMELNSKDNGKRKWICVQLQEATDEESEAYKAGYKTITEIARERIRRAGEIIKENVIQEKVPSRRGLQEVYGYKDGEIKELENDAVGDLDIGFKSFKLLSSNYRRWNTLTAEDDEKALLKQAKLFLEKPLVDGYDEESVVYEIMLKEGFDLNSFVQSPKKDQKDLPLWVVVDKGEMSGKMTITFAKKVTKEVIAKKGIGETDNEIFVCFDSALDDTTKVNIMRNLTVKAI